uniref:Uncharacterized protein n=1 Tax=Triticum urartu TaxID=4572 RepID=A0A8R7PPP9_TRIUA
MRSINHLDSKHVISTLVTESTRPQNFRTTAHRALFAGRLRRGRSGPRRCCAPPEPGRGRLRPAMPRVAPSPSGRAGRRPPRRAPDHGLRAATRPRARPPGCAPSCPWPLPVRAALPRSVASSRAPVPPTRAGALSRRGFTAALWPPSTAVPGLEHRPAGRGRHNRR